MGHIPTEAQPCQPTPSTWIQSFHQRKQISILEKKIPWNFFHIEILFYLDILLTNKQLHLEGDLNIVV